MKKVFPFFLITLVFVITGCDRVPEFKSTPNTTAYEGSEYRYSVEAVDPDGKSVSFFLIQGPQGMKLLRNNVLSWTPAFNDIGEYDIKIKADDSVKYSIQEFKLTVYAQINGTAQYLNLSDEHFYAYSGLTVNISGNGVSASTTSDENGGFYFRGVQPGEYRYDIMQPSGQAWSFYSSNRVITFITTARIWQGTAIVTGTVASQVSGTRSVTLLANDRYIELPNDSTPFTFSDLFPTSIETLIAKQWSYSNLNDSGVGILTFFPLTYALIQPVDLTTSSINEYKLSLEAEEIRTRNIWLETDGSIYELDYYGLVTVPNTLYQSDISALTVITNWNDSYQPIPINKKYIQTYATEGQNGELAYAWYSSSYWAPFKGYNSTSTNTGNYTDFDLGYPLSPSVSGGISTVEYIQAAPQKTQQPQINFQKRWTSKNEGHLPVALKIPNTVTVIKGVGTTPTFRWYGPHTGKKNPEIYIATVVEVDQSLQYVKLIWEGITQKGEFQFPNLSQPLLEAGKKYVFFVLTYAGEDLVYSQDNVLWYPQNYSYWFSRSEGILFEP